METKQESNRGVAMSELPMHSPEWFTAAFENCNDVPAYIKNASERICHAYGIRGVCDPAYIANVINAELRKSTGVFTLQEYQQLVTHYKSTNEVKHVNVAFGELEIKEKKLVNNDQHISIVLWSPITNLIQINGNCQLYWVRIDGTNSPSIFWLETALDWD